VYTLNTEASAPERQLTDVNAAFAVGCEYGGNRI